MMQHSMLTFLGGSLDLKGFVCTSTGLLLKTDEQPQDWVTVGEFLFELESALPWLIGDWLIHLQNAGQGDLSYLAAQLGHDPKHLYDYAFVARMIPYADRRKTLSFKHHMVVAHLPHPDLVTALKYAEDNLLPVYHFRKWLKTGPFRGTP